MPNETHHGSCFCGGVRFTTQGPLRPVIACHCTQCRKQSGHYWAASSVPAAQLQFEAEATLRWYAASPQAERGFCAGCGAFLFWREKASDKISFAAGALDGATGLQVAKHWYLEDAGDYDTTPGSTDHVAASCLCGANRLRLPQAAGPVWACHCGQCRKTSGHFAARLLAEGLVWEAREVATCIGPGGGVREFCPTCGAGLTLTKAGQTWLEAGICDGATGGRLYAHAFVRDKGDYYGLADGLPQFDEEGARAPT
jgi:hypothetical protein